jgi:hypothetical protein
LTIRGYRTEGFKPVSDKGIVISTRLLKRNGKPLAEVKAGDLLAEIPEGGLGARVHASIGGVVESIDSVIAVKAV